MSREQFLSPSFGSRSASWKRRVILIAFLAVTLSCHDAGCAEVENDQPGIAILHKSGSDYRLSLLDPENGLLDVDTGGLKIDWVQVKGLIGTQHGATFFATYTAPGSARAMCGGFTVDRATRRLIRFFHRDTGSIEFETLHSAVSDGRGRLLFLGKNPDPDHESKYLPYLSDGSPEGTRKLDGLPGTQFFPFRTPTEVAIFTSNRGGDFSLYSADLAAGAFTRHLHGPLNQIRGVSADSGAADYITDWPGTDQHPFFEGRATFQFDHGFATLLQSGKIAFTRTSAAEPGATPAKPILRTLPEGMRLRPEVTPVYANGRLFFSADLDGADGGPLLYFIERTGEVTLVLGIKSPNHLVASGDKVFFVADKHPMVTDGTPTGTIRLTARDYYKWRPLPANSGRSFFVSGETVLLSDGTAEGTRGVLETTGIASFEMDQSGRALYLLARIGIGTDAKVGLWFVDSVDGSVRLVSEIGDIVPKHLTRIQASICVF